MESILSHELLKNTYPAPWLVSRCFCQKGDAFVKRKGNSQIKDDKITYFIGFNFFAIQIELKHRKMVQ